MIVVFIFYGIYIKIISTVVMATVAVTILVMTTIATTIVVSANLVATIVVMVIINTKGKILISAQNGGGLCICGLELFWILTTSIVIFVFDI